MRSHGIIGDWKSMTNAILGDLLSIAEKTFAMPIVFRTGSSILPTPQIDTILCFSPIAK